MNWWRCTRSTTSMCTSIKRWFFEWNEFFSFPLLSPINCSRCCWRQFVGINGSNCWMANGPQSNQGIQFDRWAVKTDNWTNRYEFIISLMHSKDDSPFFIRSFVLRKVIKSLCWVQNVLMALIICYSCHYKTANFNIINSFDNLQHSECLITKSMTTLNDIKDMNRLIVVKWFVDIE